MLDAREMCALLEERAGSFHQVLRGACDSKNVQNHYPKAANSQKFSLRGSIWSGHRLHGLAILLSLFVPTSCTLTRREGEEALLSMRH